MDMQITLSDIKDEVTKEELLEIIGLSLDSGVSIEEAIQEFIDINYNLKGGKNGESVKSWRWMLVHKQTKKELKQWR